MFFGGEFSDENGYFHPGVVRWDGSEWSLIGSNFNDAVLALAWIDGFLYAAGDFTALGELAFPYLAAWDGQAWHAAQSPPDASVKSIWARDGEIYLGGSFSAVGSQPSALVAKGIVGERIKSLAIDAPGLGTNTIRFNGTPLGTYRIEYSDGLCSQKWSILGTTSISAYGSGSIGDPAPHPVSRFYRLCQEPSD